MIELDAIKEKHLEESAQKAASALTKGDVLAQHSLSQSVSFEFSRLHSIEDVSSTALSCRAFHRDRAGVAFVNDPKQWADAVSNAQESAHFGEEIAFSLPKPYEISSLEWAFNSKHLEYSKAQLKDLGSDLLNRLKKEAPKAKIIVEVSLSYGRSFLCNSEGFRGSERSSRLDVMGGLFELGSDGSFIELYEGESFYDNAPALDQIIRPLTQRIQWSRSAVSPEKKEGLPVFFAPSAMGILIDPLLAAANGKMLNKGLSVLEHKVGERLLSPLFHLTDEPLRLRGRSYTYDDEGVKASDLPLFEEGVFRHFIFDCASAAKKGQKSTGHGSRGISSLPVPSFSNVCLRPGVRSFRDILGDMDEAILLCEGLGEGQSNVLAGDFSVLGSSAFFVKKGVIQGRVKDLMFSGNVYEVLNNILEISSEEIQEGSLFTPYLLAEGVRISS